MALASGLGAQLGLATETTPGTPVAPTSFLTFLQESLELDQDYTKVQGLRPDVLTQQDGLHVQTTRHVTGDIQPVPLTAGMGKIFNLMTGATVTPTGSGNAKTFVFPIGNSAPDGKSATIQVGVPGVDGTVYAKTVTGAVLPSVTFAMETGGVLTCTANVWGSDLSTTQTLATASYPTGAELPGFKEAVLTLDGTAVGTCVKSVSLTFTFPKADDRYCLNGSGTALVPVTNAQIAITGNFELEFNGWAQFNAYRNATRRALSFVASGRTDIQTGTKGSIGFQIPQIVVEDNATAQVGGPDIVRTSPSFTTVSNGAAAPATITYVTADTAI